MTLRPTRTENLRLVGRCRLQENVRARLRLMVKRILRKYKYPPDQQEIYTLDSDTLTNCQKVSLNQAIVKMRRMLLEKTHKLKVAVTVAE